MRKIFVLGSVIVFILSLCSTAQAMDWEQDFEKALSEAKASGKYLLLDFSGSDWCGWCVKLDKEVFSRSEFKKFARENLVCVLIDFPKRKSQSNKIKEQNNKLAKKYGVRGFPTVILLNPDGKLIGKTGYRKGGAKAYVAHLKEMIESHKAR